MNTRTVWLISNDGYSSLVDNAPNSEPELRLMTPKHLINERVDMPTLISYIETILDHGKKLILVRSWLQ